MRHPFLCIFGVHGTTCALTDNRSVYPSRLPFFAHAQVLADGMLVGAFQRNGGVSIVLGDAAGAVAKAAGAANVTLDIIVEGVGRTNTGLKFDVKGLTSGLVLLNSALLCLLLASKRSRRPCHTHACWASSLFLHVAVMRTLQYNSSTSARTRPKKTGASSMCASPLALIMCHCQKSDRCTTPDIQSTFARGA